MSCVGVYLLRTMSEELQVDGNFPAKRSTGTREDRIENSSEQEKLRVVTDARNVVFARRSVQSFVYRSNSTTANVRYHGYKK